METQTDRHKARESGSDVSLIFCVELDGQEVWR